MIYRLKQDVQALLRRLVPQRDLFGAATEAIMELPGLTPARASTCATSAIISPR